MTDNPIIRFGCLRRWNPSQSESADLLRKKCNSTEEEQEKSMSQSHLRQILKKNVASKKIVSDYADNPLNMIPTRSAVKWEYISQSGLEIPASIMINWCVLPCCSVSLLPVLAVAFG